MKTKKNKRNLNPQVKIILPLVRRNLPLLLPLLVMSGDKLLPFKADSTSLELSLRLV